MYGCKGFILGEYDVLITGQPVKQSDRFVRPAECILVLLSYDYSDEMLPEIDLGRVRQLLRRYHSPSELLQVTQSIGLT